MELLVATCSEGHTWDVYTDDDNKIKRSDLRCPSCWDENIIRYASSVDEPESLV